ncbi:hypothetical protein I79_021969 [Cricetulus griseus]|uniref:Uncharacterized protein n=1 Tax=Cricetulus griseus TaxID=10029 RepID=G3IE27_CRIGR|nr:hypothetical protein I79_021969 [Cricetulus griseus]
MKITNIHLPPGASPKMMAGQEPTAPSHLLATKMPTMATWISHQACSQNTLSTQ